MEDEKQQRPTTGRRVKAFKGLFVRPTVRQFLHKGILYREEEERARKRLPRVPSALFLKDLISISL